MGKLRFISLCIEFATSVFSFFNKTEFYRYFFYCCQESKFDLHQVY